MLLSEAFAASPAPSSETTTAQTVTPTELTQGVDPANAPTAGEAFALNMALVLILVAMFYFLLIRPQQKRIKEHSSMLNQIDKGDKIVTNGGLIGVVEKKISDHEMVLDLGNNVKISILKSAIMGKYDDYMKPSNSTAANANKGKDVK
jgi:preprotein translocase subunit YajC